MSLSDFGKLCLFSGISGVIKLHGEPVAGARLVRTASLEFSPKRDETTTDENGYFEFPPLYERSISKYLPQEFVAKQDLVAIHEGKEYVVWDGIKRDPSENAESRGNPLVVECNLEADEVHLFVNHGWISSRCTWDVEPDPKITGPFFDTGDE
ncbi:DUF6795 domain-containing protein [Gilvimarinus sp. F26214L]|uniref:DUF6795 domain-containing protein n=1 Tax=Gilvimarinus sp. DZF01 TaxID=3461371 RepID=UPI00404573F2